MSRRNADDAAAVPRWKNQYELRANSNLVLQGDAPRSKTSNEPTGEPESLKDKQRHEFGDLAQKRKAPIDEHIKKQAEKKKKRNAPPPTEAEFGRPAKRTRTTTVLDQHELEGISYQPRTKETRQAYESLLNFVRQKLGDQQRNIIMSAADEILATIKDEEVKLKDKQAILEELLSTLTQDDMSNMHKICKEITDYTDEGENTTVPGEDEGISVLHFGGEDEEENKEEENFVIEEGDSDEEGAGEETEILPAVATTTEGDEEDAALTLDPNTIDAYWLQRELSKFIDDAMQSQQMAKEVLDVLQRIGRITELETELLELLGYGQFDFVKLLVRNRLKIVYCTKLGQAQTTEETEKLEAAMKRDPELSAILKLLRGKASSEGATLGGRMRAEQRALSKQESRRSQRETELKKEAMDILEETRDVGIPVSEYIDLDSISFHQGGHFMSNKQCTLPEGTFQNSKKGYHEVVVPAFKAPVPKEPLILIKDLPSWAHPAFDGVRDLNLIQSQCFKAFFESGDNLLLCAPTGGGKTNCAMLAMMHEIGLHLDKETNKLIDPEGFKIIYIAPMKSLVQEMVFNFGTRLAAYGIKVNELTGDASMTKQQISETQIIITTPEKWDIITRKAGDRTYTELVRLVIIDEIHLLHDERGPVLEAIIARTIRQIESTQEMVRLIGLSATLPNYQDVATLLRVKPHNLFAFPNSFRPVPLEQTFIGISVKKPIKRFQLMNKICYEKVMEQAGTNQVLVFVHSRKETAKTARELRDMALANDVIGKFLGEDSASREILITEAENAKSPDLKDLLPYGFAIHHAGLTRDDRTLVEDLMADKHIQVLVSTATLAWGVNLPAHTVIIKGTKIYNPEKGDWVELSPMDVMQMLGRAGRPQYDIKGEGVLITGRQELQYYLSLLNEQLPIESQLISKLPDNLNAEIVLGTIQNVKEAVNWLGYTYLYVCMLRSPDLYGVSPSEKERDKLLVQRRYDLVHSAATLLAKNNLIKYDRKSGSFQSTDLGRIASHYYVTHASMNVYNEHLKITSGDIEILRVFSLSGEFKDIAVRPDERLEVKKLLERVPIPIKESIDEPSAKINALLQAYISRLSLEGFSLSSDMVYVKQSAGRILRALFEIALKRGWANVAEKCLRFCIMVEKREWGTQSPLRQFKALPEEIVLRLEKKDLTIDRLYTLDSHEIGEAIDFPSLGKKVYDLVHHFPLLKLSATVQPITRSLLRVELNVEPDFQFLDKYHGTNVAFWILVEDVDGDIILHHEMFILKQKFAQYDQNLTFTVPLTEPLPPQYFIKVLADRWLGAETVLPVSFRHLILPEKYPPHTELLDLQPLPVAALKNPQFEALYRDKFTYFNPIQTQVFNTVYNTDQNVLICAPTGSGKTICAEFGLLREFSRDEPGRIVYIAPNAALAKERYRDWKQKFSAMNKQVTTVTGDWNVDQKLISNANIIISTPEHWDMASRRWKQRKVVQTVRLYVIDELHLIGGDNGPTLEIVVSRIRYITQQLKSREVDGEKAKGPITRIIGLGSSLANAKDIGEWIGATPHSLFNFHPNVRLVPLEINIQGFENPHFKQRVMSMQKPLLYAVSHHSEDKPVIIFTASRKIASQVAHDIITHSNVDERPKRYLHATQQDLEPLLQHVTSRGLKESLAQGVGFYHEAMSEREQEVVKQLFESGAIQVLVATHSTCWTLHMQAFLVLIMGTQYYEGKDHGYVDYSITDMLQMIGRAGRQGIDDAAKCVLLGDSRKKEFYKKFIYEPLPVESHLDHFLHDHLNAEIATRTIENKQDAVDYITWTFFYRRISQNPNYYNMTGVSHRHVSDHLSDLVEKTINDLVQSRCVTVEDEMLLTSINLGMIASYYYIRYTTIELFNFSLNEKTKMKGLIEILANANEFEKLTIRHKEDNALRKLAAHLPVKINKPDYTSAATKVNILFQCHFSRRVLTPDLISDQKMVLQVAPRLLQAMVDVISSNGWLTPALAAMELSQMITQALWDNDSYLKQLPYITQAHIDRIAKIKRKDEDQPMKDNDEGGTQDLGILDLFELSDEQRDKLLNMDKAQMGEVAQAANRYPNIDLQFQIQAEKHIAGQNMKLVVQLERELDEGEKLAPVIAPFYPGEKTESWWLVLGNPSTNQILAIKRLTVPKALVTAELEFEAPVAGHHECTLYFMCDSYLGCDQEWAVEFQVEPATDAPVDSMDLTN